MSIEGNEHFIEAAGEGFDFKMKLQAQKAPVLHGNAGYSRKGAMPESASCYYSFTRLAAEGTVTLTYRMDTEGPPVVPMRLKVEINTREHFSVMGFKHRPYEVRSRWFQGSCRITTFSLEELLGTKVRALFQRRKGRV